MSFEIDPERHAAATGYLERAGLLDRADLITADAVAIFPHSGLESLDADYCGRLGSLLTLLLTFAVRDARVDSRGAGRSPGRIDIFSPQETRDYY